MKTNEVFSFDVWVAGIQQSIDHPYSVNARTSGQAKMEYLRMLDRCFEVDFTRLRVRKIGDPRTSEEFLRNAQYRGIPKLKCGDRVKVGDGVGVVVGHNSSANFDVLFDPESPKYPGLRLNVHPQDLQLESEAAA